jgi:hypothetical protein
MKDAAKSEKRHVFLIRAINKPEVFEAFGVNLKVRVIKGSSPGNGGAVGNMEEFGISSRRELDSCDKSHATISSFCL